MNVSRLIWKRLQALSSSRLHPRPRPPKSAHLSGQLPGHAERPLLPWGPILSCCGAGEGQQTQMAPLGDAQGGWRKKDGGFA